MLENALQLLVAGQQQDGTLSPQPVLQSAQWLSWLRGVPLLGELCAHPCRSTPWDQARREPSLPFMRKRSRWEIIPKKKKKSEEVACKTKATLEIKGTLKILAQASPPFPTCPLPCLTTHLGSSSDCTYGFVTFECLMSTQCFNVQRTCRVHGHLPSSSPHTLFTAALGGCPAAAAFRSLPCSCCIHEGLCWSPTVHALPPPAGPIPSLSQTCCNSGLQPLPACLPQLPLTASGTTVLPCPTGCLLRTCCGTAACLLCCSHAGLDYCARY